MDYPAVKALIEKGKRMAGCAPSSSSSKRAPTHPGRGKVMFQNAKRHGWKESGGVWSKEKEVEWAAQWEALPEEGKEAWEKAVSDKARRRVLQGLDDITAEGAATLAHTTDGPEPDEQQLGIFARLCSREFPLAPERVTSFLRCRSLRGGVRKPAKIIRRRASLFITDPGEAASSDPDPRPGAFRAPPVIGRRCVEMHPGFCATEFGEAMSQRIRDTARWLHFYGANDSKRAHLLEPLVQLDCPTAEADGPGESSIWLWAGQRAQYTTQVWLRCSEAPVQLGGPAEEHRVGNRTLAIVDASTASEAAVERRTSWSLAKMLATTDVRERGWRFRLMSYRFLTLEEAESIGVTCEELGRFMVETGVSEDTTPGCRLASLIAKREESMKAAKVALTNPELADLASLLARRGRAKAAPKVEFAFLGTQVLLLYIFKICFKYLVAILAQAILAQGCLALGNRLILWWMPISSFRGCRYPGALAVLFVAVVVDVDALCRAVVPGAVLSCRHGRR